jgi:hypothetical protein
LRQLGLAILNYHDAHGRFPVGVNIPNVNVAPHGPASFGWGGIILPYMEETTLASQYQAITVGDLEFPDYNWETAQSGGIQAGELSKTELSVFACPTDVMPPINLIYNGGKDPYSKSNYVGVAGQFGAIDASSSAPLYFVNPVDVENPASSFYANRALYDQTYGIFGGNQKTKISHVTDGTSKTLMVTERDGGDVEGATGASPRRAAYWAGAIRARWLNSTLTNVDDDVDGKFLINSDNFRYGVGSLHIGGVNACLGDGHVVFLNENMDGNAWKFMGSMADGEVIPNL